MATLTNSTRTTLAQRAAITLMVCAELFLCGCRSPWRTWRNDEPSLEQLLIHPEPWDAEARLEQEAPTRRTGSARSSDKSYGRTNPYAARDAAARPVGDVDADDESADQSSQAEFEAAYAAAPPHLRGLLKRQWDATRARNTKPVTDDSSADPSADSKADATVATEDDANTKVALARGSRSGDPAVSYHLSDDESSAAQADPKAADDVALADEEGTAIYSLKDIQPKAIAQRSAESKQPTAELPPPPGKQLTRQVAHAEPVDTGAGNDVLVKPAPTTGKRSAQPAAVATGKTAPKSAPAGQPASYVATASAEVTAEADSASAAVAEEEIQVAQTEAMDWRDHVREALRQLEAEPESSADNPAEQLHRQASSRLLRLTLGELEPALKPIEGLQTHEQEFFRHGFQSLHDAIDPKGNPVLSRRWTLALDSHRKAMSHLSAVSNLEIKNAHFCTDVHSYGVIGKFPNPHFQPNQELLLYCELDNFSAEPVKDGYETQLQGSYEIVDASGRRVADMLLPEDADICRNPRRDYFIAYRIYMPQKIEPGRYQLRLTIEDMKGRKFGQTALDFQIAP